MGNGIITWTFQQIERGKSQITPVRVRELPISVRVLDVTLGLPIPVTTINNVTPNKTAKRPYPYRTRSLSNL